MMARSLQSINKAFGRLKRTFFDGEIRNEDVALVHLTSFVVIASDIIDLLSVPLSE